MKLINNEIYNSLVEKAKGFDVIAGMIAEATNSDKENISIEMIVEALTVNSPDPTELTPYKEKIASLEREVEILKSEKDDLKKQLKNMTDAPAENPASIRHEQDGTTQEEDITVYADSHNGDILAIAREMKRRGLK